MKSHWFKSLSKLAMLLIIFGQSQGLQAQQNNTISIFAVQPSWVRVLDSGGNTVREQILDACEALSISVTGMPLKLKAGNSSSIYVILNEAMYGPIGVNRSVVTTPLYPPHISENFVQIDGNYFEDVSAIRNALNCEPNIRNDYSPSKTTTARNNKIDIWNFWRIASFIPS